jgi:hypothetical protein
MEQAMKRFRFFSVLAVVVLFVACAAQTRVPLTEPTSRPVSRATPTPLDLPQIPVSPELQRALDQLAATMATLGQRIANDPALRVAALQAANRAVSVAQVMVEQNSAVLQDALKAAAERIATMPMPVVPPAPRR